MAADSVVKPPSYSVVSSRAWKSKFYNKGRKTFVIEMIHVRHAPCNTYVMNLHNSSSKIIIRMTGRFMSKKAKNIMDGPPQQRKHSPAD